MTKKESIKIIKENYYGFYHKPLIQACEKAMGALEKNIELEEYIAKLNNGDTACKLIAKDLEKFLV